MNMKKAYKNILVIGISFVIAVFAILTELGQSSYCWKAWPFVACAVIIILNPSAWEENSEKKKEKVEYDESSIRRYMVTGKIESITWDELYEIGIVTTDEGPVLDDVFWIFLNHDKSKGCAVSNNAEGFGLLLRRIQCLPNFDNETVIRAMGCTTNNRFVIWKRTDSDQSSLIDSITN